MIFVLFLTLEVSTRLDDAIKYDAPLWRDYSGNDLRAKDNDGLTYNVPTAKFEKWQHNSLGFRGTEIMHNKSSGVVRVVCVGTSESYGLYESPNKEWPSQLQKLLPSPKFEVVNASVVGFSLPSYGAYLKKHVFPLNPDVIILVIHPFMYVSNLEKATTEMSAPPNTTEKNESINSSLAKKLWRKTRILPKIKFVIRQLVANNLPFALKRYQLWSVEKEIENIERLRLNGRRPMDTVPDNDLKYFQKELNSLVALIRSKGIKVMLTTYPTLISYDNISQYKEIFLDNRRYCIYLSLYGMVDAAYKINAVIEHTSIEKRTMLFDAASIIPKSTDYFGDNVHYTDNGAKLFAEGIARQLICKKHPVTSS